jgi:hypothetical protein
MGTLHKNRIDKNRRFPLDYIPKALMNTSKAGFSPKNKTAEKAVCPLRKKRKLLYNV